MERVDEVQVGSWAEIVSGPNAAPAAMFTLGIVLHAFNAFIASTTMPSAATELHTVALLSWATSAYLVASIVGGASAAVLKARLGARSVLLASSLAFIAGSFAFGFAQNASSVVLGRILQGAGEGIVMACCYALIPEMFPKSLVPRIFALESVAWALAALGGPVIAGAITEATSWRLAAMASIPASIAFMIFVPLCVPAGRGNGKALAIPIVQLALVAAGVFLLSVGGRSSLAIAALIGAPLLLWLVVVIDGRSESRILPSRAFDPSTQLGASMLLALLMALVEAPTVIFIAFAGQRIWGLGVTLSGLLSAVLAISWSLTAIGVAHMPRLSARSHIWPAPMIMALGLSLHVAAFALQSLVAAVAAQMLIGISFGFSWARLCEHVMETASDGERDFAVAAMPTLLVAGSSIGAALAGSFAAMLGLDAARSTFDIARSLAPVFAVAAAAAVATVWVSRRAAT
ncbi:MAG: MFS transporter [Alphaproteobacteria bacterium]|nr:MFS transporter [Alphaproteobacteria bacterium]